MLAACCCFLVVALGWPGESWLERATGGTGRVGTRPRRERVPLSDDRLRRTVLCVVAVTAIAWAVVGRFGLALGPAAGAALSWWIGRLESPRVARERERIRTDLPLAADLLAACADVGLPPERALDVVAAAVEGPVGAVLSGVRLRVSLGADPSVEWGRLAQRSEFAGLSRTMLRTLESGAPLAAGLSRLAADRRRDLRSSSQVKARKVGVLSAAPLGLCFLPAFMLVGVVPTVASLFTGLLVG